MSSKLGKKRTGGINYLELLELALGVGLEMGSRGASQEQTGRVARHVLKQIAAGAGADRSLLSAIDHLGVPSIDISDNWAMVKGLPGRKHPELASFRLGRLSLSAAIH
jgi:hypothetical protein